MNGLILREKDMKKGWIENEMLIERNKLILELYKKMKRTCQYSSVGAICEEIASQPTVRHYLSEQMGVIIWSKWRRNNGLPANIKPHKRKVYLSLIAECERLRGKASDMNAISIVRKALETPAPCIGIGPHQIFMILKQFNMR